MSPPAVVIGIDPGGRWTGLVVRQGSRLVDFDVLESTHAPRELPTMAYVYDVIAWVANRSAEVLAALGVPAQIAAEGMKVPEFRRGAPTGERNRVRPEAVMGLVMVYTGVRVAFPDSVEVAPGGHGEGPLSAYPAELVGRERKGTGILRHARSAWDVAGAARLVLAIQRSAR